MFQNLSVMDWLMLGGLIVLAAWMVVTLPR